MKRWSVVLFLWATVALAGAPSEAEPRSYLMLDGVALKEVVLAARRMNPEFRTLYDHVVESEFVEMSPHLFNWVPDSRFAQLWLAAGHGHGLGLRVLTRASAPEVVSHLQQFLLVDVVKSDGPKEQLYLRLYDPRVLHTVLKALKPAQLKAFFGPVEAFVLEDDDDPAFDLEYRLDREGQLASSRQRSPVPDRSPRTAQFEVEHLVKTEDAENVRKHLEHFGQLQSFSSAAQTATPFVNVCPCNAFKLTRASGLTLEPDQFQRFSEHALRWYKRGVFDWLAANSAREFPASKLKQLIDDGYQQAQGYGITTQQPVREYLDLCVRHGLGFHLKPWAQKILKDEGLDGPQKVERLKAAAPR